MKSIEELAEEYRIRNIEEKANKLLEVCPVYRVNPDFSPKEIAALALKEPERLLRSQLIWECLACGLCRVATDGEVNMSYFIRDLREKAWRMGFLPTMTHGGMLITAQRPGINYKKTSGNRCWLTDDMKLESKTGYYLYWAGGAPFFDAVMPELEPGAVDSARAGVRLLNRLGIRPVILDNGRFSGHDLLWIGDIDGFKRLAEQNLKDIKKAEAGVVIVASPEDYYTLARSYNEYFGSLDFEVIHITEFLAERLDNLEFNALKKRVTYQDPCRLGRGMGVYEAPRKLLRAIPGLDLVEMPTSGEYSSCCGTSCWINCNRYSKLMQVNRLREAVGVGARLLVTACWECDIHFRCALRPQAWRQVCIDTEDLVNLVSSLIKE